MRGSEGQRIYKKENRFEIGGFSFLIKKPRPMP